MIATEHVASGAHDANGHRGPIDDASAVASMIVPPIFPTALTVSGRYRLRRSAVASRPVFEELRLDVDGAYPQMVASGTIRTLFSVRPRGVHWFAKLRATGQRSWGGTIRYKDDDGAPTPYPFPYTQVAISVSGTIISISRTATVTLSGAGVADRITTLTLASPYYRDVEFEYDRVERASAVTSFQVQAHPNRPPSLPEQTLTIDAVFRRAGFDVKKSGGDSVVPLSATNADARWSDAEMHDAMQVYWSRFANKAQWSLWTLFASLHERGTGLGGIMFDDIGPNHRQGTAIFEDSFIKSPPPGDPAPEAWVRRMRFFAAIHEMGHAFNLAHSWQKSLVDQGDGPWIALADEPEARSIMNYPQAVSGGQTAFFSDFEYRFSDAELLFMRHAPERFVEMGNADWFDHHGFEQLDSPPEPKLKLEVRVNRPRPDFEFLEPVVLELKLTNVSDGPRLIQEDLLSDLGRMTVVVKRDGRAARQYLPYAQFCQAPRSEVLGPGESRYESLFVSAGKGGWNIDEPGRYTVQLAVHVDGEGEVVSNALRLRIAPPRGYDEAYVAQDLFTDDVGRILAFDGSRHLTDGNDTLREVVERLGDRRVAVHARVALAMPLMRDFKQLVLPPDCHTTLRSAADLDGAIRVGRPRIDVAADELGPTLVERADQAAETLGHVDTRYYVERYAEALAAHGETGAAADAQDALHRAFERRGVLRRVLEEVRALRDSYRLGNDHPSQGRP